MYMGTGNKHINFLKIKIHLFRGGIRDLEGDLTCALVAPEEDLDFVLSTHKAAHNSSPRLDKEVGRNLYHSLLGFLGDEPQLILISQSCKIRVPIFQMSKVIQMLQAACPHLDLYLPNYLVSPLIARPVFRRLKPLQKKEEEGKVTP